MADQWEEYFYCDSIPPISLAVKGSKKTPRRGSIKRKRQCNFQRFRHLQVNEGQCMMIIRTRAGLWISVPSPGNTFMTPPASPLFYGDLGENTIRRSFGKFRNPVCLLAGSA